MAPESGLPEKNVGSLFDLIDADRDGYITADDMPAAGRRALDELGITDSRERAEILALYPPIWEQLRADCDSDGDGRITRQEFTTAFTSGLGPAGLLPAAIRYLYRPDRPDDGPR